MERRFSLNSGSSGGGILSSLLENDDELGALRSTTDLNSFEGFKLDESRSSEEQKQSQIIDNTMDPDDEFGFNQIIMPKRGEQLLGEMTPRNNIAMLTRRVQNKTTHHHLETFEKNIDDLVVEIDSIPIEFVEEIEKKKLDEEKAAFEADRQLFIARMERLHELKEEAIKRIHEESKERHESLSETNSINEVAEEEILQKQSAAIDKLSGQLHKILEDERNVIEASFGQLVERDIEQEEINWNDQPRKITIQIDFLRAVKNKLRGGQYVMMVTLFDRLGGFPMRQCVLGKYGHSATTTPKLHQGSFNIVDITWKDDADAAVVLAAPPTSQINPANVLIFELFKARGLRNKTDIVVGWGAFPLVSSGTWDVVKGKYKVPLLRGDMDPTFDKYSKIDEAISNNIDAWLCNCYFTVSHMARKKKELNEYSSQLRLTDRMLKLKTRPQRPHVDSDDDDDEFKDIFETGDDSNTLTDLGFNFEVEDENGEDNAQKDWEKSIAKEARRMAIRKSDNLRKYKYSVTNVEGDIPSKPHKDKIRYLWGIITEDMSLAKYKTMDTWSFVMILCFVLWFRMYIHYLGQYCILYAMNIQVYDFTPRFMYCNLKYSQETIEKAKEGIVVVFGQMSNIVVYCLHLLVAGGIQSKFDVFPDTASRYMLCYGLCTCFDALLIGLVDLVRWNSQGDLTKLYHIYNDRDANAIGGILLTAVIFIILFAFSTFLTYFYLYHFHMNGRMLDLYHRLHGDEGNVYVPHDLEISVRTLKWIINKSRDWKGFHGTRRKVSVTKYCLEDHADPDWKEVTYHLCIYNCTRQDHGEREEREMYRHFIRTHDGMICEIFETEESLGAHDYVAIEEPLLTKELSYRELEDMEIQALELKLAEQRKQQDLELHQLELAAEDALHHGQERRASLISLRNSKILSKSQLDSRESKYDSEDDYNYSNEGREGGEGANVTVHYSNEEGKQASAEVIFHDDLADANNEQIFQAMSS